MVVSPDGSRRIERRHDDERATGVGIARHLLHGDDAEVGERLDQSAVQRATFQRIDGSTTGDQQHVLTCHGRPAQHHITAMADDGSPLADPWRVQRCADHSSVRRIQRRQPDQTIAGEHERRLSIYPLDDSRPFTTRDIEQKRVGAAPPNLHLDQQVLTIGRHADVGPGLVDGQAVEDDRIVARLRAQPMETNVAVVLIIHRIARIPEAGAIGQPRHRGGPRVSDAHIVQLAGGDTEHVQHTVFGAALAQPDGHHRAIVRRLEPVDRHRAIGRMGRRIEQQARRRLGVDRRPKEQCELVGPSTAFQHEQRIAAHLAAEHSGQCHERRKAPVPPFPVGTGIERLSGVLILRRYPLGHFERIARLEPPVGVGQLDAVKGVDNILTPGWRRK